MFTASSGFLNKSKTCSYNGFEACSLFVPIGYKNIVKSDFYTQLVFFAVYLYIHTYPKKIRLLKADFYGGVS